MTPASVIRVEGVSKRFLLGEGGSSYMTARDALASAFRRRLRPARREEFWALREIDVEIGVGEVVGLIGLNGAGKSTLLKLIAHISAPTTGRVRTRGRIAALLEAGTGFHPELTGRENAYLNGAFLGMSRRQVRERLDGIAEFAGVERFMDTPLKRYSTGMRLRLAFAVAAHAEPDILVMDEALAVGDLDFQRRSLERMSALPGQGGTVIFVSHDLGAVAALCDRVLWLHEGRLWGDGPTHEVIDAFRHATLRSAAEVTFDAHDAGPVGLRSIAITAAAGQKLERIDRGQPLRVALGFETHKPLPGLDMAIYLSNREGVRVIDEDWLDQPGAAPLAPAPGRYEVVMQIPPMLPAGEYVVGTWFGDNLSGTLLERELLRFELLPLPEDHERMLKRHRASQPPVSWTVRAVAVTHPQRP